MQQTTLIRYALSVAIAAALAPAMSHAQEAAPAEPSPAEPATSQQDATTLDTVVVSGSATGGVSKLEASYNIVTANEEQIKQANPKSTADLLKISPGLWPETSGGQTGANIEIAGFPGGGDAPYFSTLLMGSPLYGMPTLSFFETTSIFRLDDTVEAVEILQGGPSVVFADGQIGATANFFLKTGTEKPSGSVGLTYGDENLWRLDAFSGFKIADDWYGSVGGFWRTSDGVRSPGYPADKGGQLTATLAHDFDKGNLTLYARYLDDNNQFITPIPVVQSGTDSFSAYPGFDPLTSTYYSESIRHVYLAGYPGGGTEVDLADGRGAKMFFIGGNFDYEFDNGWKLSNKFIVNQGDVDTAALFSGSNPASLEDELYNVSTDLGGFGLPAGSATATYADDGSAVSSDQSVIHQGYYYIRKRMENFNNDLRLSNELFEGNTLTIGLYYAHYTTHDKWALGNQMLMTNEPNARAVQVSYVGEDGQTYYLTDDQGLLDYGSYNIEEYGKANNVALYLSDSWSIGNWLLDASMRAEHMDANVRVCNLHNVNLDGDPYTLYDNETSQCDGTFTETNYSKTHPAWSLGANYKFNDHTSAYVRVNRGGHFPDFDNGLRGHTSDNPAPVQTVRNYEAGFKYQSRYLYADLSVYRRIFSGLQYSVTDSDGVPTGETLIYGSDTKGVNLVGAVTPVENLRIQVTANYMDGKYTDYDGCVPYSNEVTGGGCAPIEDEQLQRQPTLRYMLTPSYRIPFAWGDIAAYVTYTKVGDRTQDQSGLQQLGSYHTWDFGVTSNIGEHWSLALRGTNITNEFGLTESNSRIFGSAQGTDGVLLARPIEGREVNMQVKYSW